MISMFLTHFSILASGSGLLIIAFAMRRKKKNNWIPLAAGGITMLIVEVFILVSGFKL